MPNFTILRRKYSAVYIKITMIAYTTHILYKNYNLNNIDIR